MIKNEQYIFLFKKFRYGHIVFRDQSACFVIIAIYSKLDAFWDSVNMAAWVLFKLVAKELTLLYTSEKSAQFICILLHFREQMFQHHSNTRFMETATLGQLASRLIPVVSWSDHGYTQHN